MDRRSAALDRRWVTPEEARRIIAKRLAEERRSGTDRRAVCKNPVTHEEAVRILARLRSAA